MAMAAATSTSRLFLIVPLFLLLLLAGPQSALAQTPIVTVITPTTLNTSLSPYLVTSVVTVSSQLTVPAGVTIRFSSSGKFSVTSSGSIVTQGTSANPVLFTPSSSASWPGIDFASSSSLSALAFTKMYGCTTCVNVLSGNLLPTFSSVQFFNPDKAVVVQSPSSSLTTVTVNSIAVFAPTNIAITVTLTSSSQKADLRDITVADSALTGSAVITVNLNSGGIPAALQNIVVTNCSSTAISVVPTALTNVTLTDITVQGVGGATPATIRGVEVAWPSSGSSSGSSGTQSIVTLNRVSITNTSSIGAIVLVRDDYTNIAVLNSVFSGCGLSYNADNGNCLVLSSRSSSGGTGLTYRISNVTISDAFNSGLVINKIGASNIVNITNVAVQMINASRFIPATSTGVSLTTFSASTGSTVSLDGFVCQFMNGSALAIYSATATSGIFVSVSNSRFSNNNGVDLDMSAAVTVSTVTVTNTTFRSTGLQAIRATSGYYTVSNSAFVGNGLRADLNALEAGAIFSDAHILRVTYSSFSQCNVSAVRTGSARNNQLILIANNVFSNNSRDAVWMSGPSYLSVNISNNVLANNSVQVSNVALMRVLANATSALNGPVYVTQNTFTRNTFTSQLSVLLLFAGRDSGNITEVITNNVFTNNTVRYVLFAPTGQKLTFRFNFMSQNVFPGMSGSGYIFPTVSAGVNAATYWTGAVNASLNYWGTVIESEISALIQPKVTTRYIPFLLAPDTSAVMPTLSGNIVADTYAQAPSSNTNGTSITLSPVPYAVYGSLRVLSSYTLTIPSGARLVFGLGRNMYIDGKLVVGGSSYGSVVFAPEFPEGPWGSLQFSASSSPTVYDGSSYGSLASAANGNYPIRPFLSGSLVRGLSLTNGGFVCPDSTSLFSLTNPCATQSMFYSLGNAPFIEYMTVTFSAGLGAVFDNLVSELEVRNSVFSYNAQSNVLFTQLPSSTRMNNTFVRGSIAGHGIAVQSGTANSRDFAIAQCYIADNAKGGLNIQQVGDDVNVVVLNTVLRNNTDSAIELWTPSSTGRISRYAWLTGLVVQEHAKFGFRIRNFKTSISSNIMTNSAIYTNQTGILVENDAVIPGSVYSTDISDSVLTNNSLAINMTNLYATTIQRNYICYNSQVMLFNPSGTSACTVYANVFCSNTGALDMVHFRNVPSMPIFFNGNLFENNTAVRLVNWTPNVASANFSENVFSNNQYSSECVRLVVQALPKFEFKYNYFLNRVTAKPEVLVNSALNTNYDFSLNYFNSDSSVSVGATATAGTVSGSNLLRTYPPTFSSITPNSGAVSNSSNAVSIVRGVNFVNTQQYTCRFGLPPATSISSTATFVNSTALSCPIPLGFGDAVFDVVGELGARVILGTQLKNRGLFRFVTIPSLQVITPASLDVDSTDQTIIAIGTGFYQFGSVGCVLQKQVSSGPASPLIFVPGVWLADRFMQCDLRSYIPSVGTYSLNVTNYGFDLTLSQYWSTASVNLVVFTAPSRTRLAATPLAFSQSVDQYVTPVPRFEVLDQYGNVAASNDIIVTISVTPVPKIVSGNTAVTRDGVAVFSLLTIIGSRGVNYTLTFTAGSLPSINCTVAVSSCGATLDADPLDGTVCTCRAGYTQTSTSDPSNPTCESCAANMYKDTAGLSPCRPCPTGTTTNGNVAVSDVSGCSCYAGYFANATAAVLGRAVKCNQCPKGGVCSGGYSQPYAQPGYYQSNTEPSIFVACIDAESCVGNDTCVDGRSSFMCAQCQPNYYRDGSSCKLCSSGRGAVLVTLFIFLLLILCMLLVRFSLSSNVDGSKYGAAGIGLNFLQVTALYTSAKTSWPNSILQSFQTASAVNLNINLSSPECAFSFITFQVKWAVTLLIPLIVPLLVVLGTFMVWFYYETRRKFSREFHENMNKNNINVKSFVTAGKRAYMMLLSFCYIPMVNAVLGIFNCSTLEDGQRVLFSAPWISCSSSEYTELLPGAYIAAVAYIFGIPALFAYLLYTRRELLDNPRTMVQFGYLYRRYRTDLFWWEVVVMVRKFLIVLVLALLTSSIAIQVVAAVTVLLIFLLLNVALEPYKRLQLTRLESACLFTNLITILVALMFSDSINVSDGVQVTILVFVLMLLVLNVSGILIAVLYEIYLVIQVLRSYLSKKKDTTDEERDTTGMPVIGTGVIINNQELKADELAADEVDSFVHNVFVINPDGFGTTKSMHL